jgi:hypothetical protein
MSRIRELSGRLTLTAKIVSNAKGKKKRPKTTTIGAATFSVPPGKTTTIKIKVNAVGRPCSAQIMDG